MGQAQIKKKKTTGMAQGFKSKEKYFIQNGGILLEKQIALSRGQDVVQQLKIYSQEEIKNATDNYNPNNLIFSRNGEANAYKGIIDDVLVFIKTPQDDGLNHELRNLFLNEVSILMVMHHDNICKMYGCCLETYIPMIVYRYGSDKNLHQYLYGDVGFQKHLDWRGRLNVATDVAYSLSYMHNALSRQVVHRNMNSFIIFFDSSFHAIVANVAHSVSITPGKKDQRWPIEGTLGYIDPEYVKTREVTDKCDVYSFGVLMLELLTSRDPIEMASCGKYLAIEFVTEVERNSMSIMSTFEEGDIAHIQRFARLALKCVAEKGEERPTMIDVVKELWHIQDYDNSVVCNDRPIPIVTSGSSPSRVLFPQTTTDLC